MTLSSQDKPKQSLNSRIAYALTDRKILHFRYDAHLRQQVMKQLSKTQRELLNRLAAAGMDALPKKQLDTLLKELKQEVAKVYQEMTAYTQDELSGFFAAETQHIHQLYNDEVGFDFFNQVPEYKQKANKTATIIAGSPLEDWWAKQGNDFAFKFEGIIRQGLLDGQQTSQMLTDVKHLMNTSRRHAETLVITAVAKVADKAHQALRDENRDILAGEKHLSTLDTRTSTVCQLRDGLMWDLDKKPIDHDVPYQRPPLHPRCRSILQLVTKSWKELGIDAEEMPSSTRASQDGPVSEQINYENWLKSKSPGQQDQVLGKGKSDLWRRGVITFADMLDQSGRPLTLKDLYLTHNLDVGYSTMNSIEELRQKAIDVEPEITEKITEIISSVGAKTAGLEYRLKSLESLKRKVETEVLAGISEKQAINSVKDVIRYTAILDVNNFVLQYDKIQSALEKQGYFTVVVKNTWKDSAVYKGVNTFVTTLIKKDNVVFELQYHTQQSFDLKNGVLHNLYEQFRDPATPQDERKKLYEKMQILSSKLTVPKDIQKVKGVK
ncbi:minor capsid protein [Glaesserella parasuis]|uniref:Minor capsid protein n=1 Tax=Glaesserella parasuis TaxID=738 RepID=A0AAX1M3Y7_GLAPU|nr:minor capsid protein [Glaesserella parasuis]MCT8517327.1 minor capsid protein [Glaesserella parasuis]MDO9837955.1 minor capsid protein [Glaesserella parasuis]MDO9888605.1 minor capsid protein [Glaesserella parasuis]MDO9906024.1 minor capsid protein [Glaesserella parasuis]MDP0372562.1 minor capsid protein [Glaesserella parasuis]